MKMQTGIYLRKCFILLALSTVYAGTGCDSNQSQKSRPEESTTAIPSTPPPLPKSSLAANSTKGTWRINNLKNPITGEVTIFVDQRSKKAMYNKYSSDDFEKVTLSVNCSSGSGPSLSLAIDGVLESDSTDHYTGDAKIDDKTMSIRWYVKNGIMVSSGDNVVQQLQTGKTFMMSYRFYEGGVEYPEFDLTGLRTEMAKAGCPKLTE